MSQFITAATDETEPQFRQWLASLYDGEGVVSGLAVSQTATASGSVLVAAGKAVQVGSTLEGAKPIISDAQETIDVLGANPMSATPRNDIIVFDPATVSAGTGGIKVIVGTPNASPTDPTVPATAIKLARIRNIGSATVVRDTGIDDLRTFTTLKGMPHVQLISSPTTTDANGITVINHGAPFTPSAVLVQAVTPGSNYYYVVSVDSFTATTCRVRWGWDTSNSIPANVDTGGCLAISFR